MDVYKIRPREGWVLVIEDPRKEKTAGGIILPGAETGIEKVTEGSGEIISVGRGKKNHLLGLEKGLRILYRGFIKHAHKVPVDEKWPDGQERIVFFMNSDDIIGVVPPGVEVGVFSGRPQVPEKR